MAVAAMLFAVAVTVFGVLTVMGVIHSVNGAGDEVSTPLNVVAGMLFAVVGAVSAVGQVNTLREGVWPDMSSSSTGSATSGGAGFDADVVDHDW